MLKILSHTRKVVSQAFPPHLQPKWNIKILLGIWVATKCYDISHYLGEEFQSYNAMLEELGASETLHL